MVNDIKNCTTCANMNQSPKFCADCEDYSGYIPKTVIRDICKECQHNNTEDYIDCTLCNGGSHFIRNEKFNCKNCKHSEESIYECKDCINHSDFKSKEDTYMSESNNRKDKIKELEEYLNKAFNLLNEIKEEEKVKEANEKNILEEYRATLCNEGSTVYAIDEFNDIIDGKVPSGADFPSLETIDRCANYPTKEIAKQSLALKSFNDKLLAFKYCYDKDYKPNWNNDYERKYYVYVNHHSKEPYFDCSYCTACCYNDVYFSSEEIAKKCCDYLNNDFKKVKEYLDTEYKGWFY